jgi:pantetheine-phosphate adenylyltransferase
MERKGIFPGTFDPMTLGHVDVLTRALHLFDHMTVAVASSERHHKETLFSVEERLAMVRASVPEEQQSRVEVVQIEGLLADFARERGIRAVIRGVRFVTDFEYEFQMALMNQKLWAELDTVFLLPNEQYSYVNSTLVKEIAMNGGNVDGLVPPDVARRLRLRFRTDQKVTD